MKTQPPKPPKPHPCDVWEQVEWIRQNHKTTWYIAYMRTDWWQFVRRRCMERAANACERCHDRTAREVHHLTYGRLGDELPEDVIAVCRQCHAELHGRVPPFSDTRGGWKGMPEVLDKVLDQIATKFINFDRDPELPQRKVVSRKIVPKSEPRYPVNPRERVVGDPPSADRGPSGRGTPPLPLEP